MADGHRAAVDVEAIVRNAEFLLEHQRHAAKGLVDFKQVNVGRGQTRFRQRLAGGIENSGELDHRVGCRHGGADEARARLQAMLLGIGAAGDQQRGGAIADLRRVGGRGGTVGGKHGLERGHLLGVRVGTHAFVGSDERAVWVGWVFVQSHQLVLDSASLQSLGGAPMAAHGESVQGLAREAEALVHQLRRSALRQQRVVLVARQFARAVLRAQRRAGFE
mmetsp:Transcript_5996/g.23900  ORF Transcript_5996/g.23900 Transcript_5996/m.23900 type:complete len:220 (+) Transcript_5996:384-1043(+)